MLFIGFTEAKQRARNVRIKSLNSGQRSNNLMLWKKIDIYDGVMIISLQYTNLCSLTRNAGIQLNFFSMQSRIANHQ